MQLALDTQKQKKTFSFRGFAPRLLFGTGVSAPYPHWGYAPDLRYRLALRARHGIQTMCGSKLIVKKAVIDELFSFMFILINMHFHIFMLYY